MRGVPPASVVLAEFDPLLAEGQPYVDRLQSNHAAGMTLLRHAAPELVHAAESKLRGDAVDPKIYADAMRGLTDHPDGDRLDVVVLGCTHFPLVQAELAAVATNIRFVDGAAGIARRIVHLTQGQSWPRQSPSGIFLTTGALAEVDNLRPALLACGLTQIKSL